MVVVVASAISSNFVFQLWKFRVDMTILEMNETTRLIEEQIDQARNNVCAVRKGNYVPLFVASGL